MEKLFDATQARRARVGVSLYFATLGMMVGTWAPHIPLAKERLAADAGAFGLALLCMGLGAIIAMPATGWLINRFGSAAVALATATLALAALFAPFAAPTLPLFALGLLVFGGALGSFDVAMNAHGLIVEGALRKPVMSSLHGMYGLAALAAAGLAALLITRIGEPQRALVSMACCAIMIALASRMMLPATADRGQSRSSFALPTRRTIGLGGLCFLALMIEGSVVDWAGIFLREERSASATVTSLTFAAFAACMAASRFLGDYARARVGAIAVTRWCAVATAAMLVAAVMSPTPVLALVFFGLAGFAIGPIAPIVFAGGGRAEPDNPGRGIAAATTLGYLGFVTGPPLVGFAADATSLATALATMAAVALVIAAAARLAGAADGFGDTGK